MEKKIILDKTSINIIYSSFPISYDVPNCRKKTQTWDALKIICTFSKSKLQTKKNG